MKIRKDIDYIKVLKDSVNFTWANKWLWLFGLIMAVFAGRGSSQGIVSNFSTSSGMSSGDTELQFYN
ncbi:MAG: hypothetical protein U9Q67_00760 [Patescibacteria group bacterium]|nr:hypothetical protein [Patescibacteria group bacterium]